LSGVILFPKIAISTTKQIKTSESIPNFSFLNRFHVSADKESAFSSVRFLRKRDIGFFCVHKNIFLPTSINLI